MYYISKKSGIVTRFSFIPATELPKDLCITTPFTFAIDSVNNYMLTKDKNGWWNPLGGHVDKGETWITALERESLEEGGIEISNIEIFGYVLAETLEGSNDQYPRTSILPFTHSKIRKIDTSWKPLETFERRLFSRSGASEVFLKREDNRQMYHIFKYLTT